MRWVVQNGRTGGSRVRCTRARRLLPTRPCSIPVGSIRTLDSIADLNFRRSSRDERHGSAPLNLNHDQLAEHLVGQRRTLAHYLLLRDARPLDRIIAAVITIAAVSAAAALHNFVLRCVGDALTAPDLAIDGE